MSTWRWKYDPEHCDHGVCVGDCDLCDREDDEEEKEGFWYSIGHVSGLLSHPYSETFKCSNCGYEQYTLFIDPPAKCPKCKASMKKEKGEPIPQWRGCMDGADMRLKGGIDDN